VRSCAGGRRQRRAVVCIGRPFGHAQSVINCADDVIRLSSCVLNHQVRAEGLPIAAGFFTETAGRLGHATVQPPTCNMQVANIVLLEQLYRGCISYKDRSIIIE